MLDRKNLLVWDWDSSLPSECLCVTRRTDLSPNEHNDATKTFHICSYRDKGCKHASKSGTYEIRHDLNGQEFSLILGLHKIHPKAPAQRCRWWVVNAHRASYTHTKTSSLWQNQVTMTRSSQMPHFTNLIWFCVTAKSHKNFKNHVFFKQVLHL